MVVRGGGLGNTLVESRPKCYFDMPTVNGTHYCPAPRDGQNFTDVYTVSLWSSGRYLHSTYVPE